MKRTLILGILTAVAGVACSRYDSGPHQVSKDVLTISGTIPIDLGVVPTGGQESETIRLVNATSERISIARIETTCDCLTVDCKRRDIEPLGETCVALNYKLDPDSHFQGPLLVKVSCMDSQGHLLLGFGVKVFVVSRAELSASGNRSTALRRAIPLVVNDASTRAESIGARTALSL